MSSSNMLPPLCVAPLSSSCFVLCCLLLTGLLPRFHILESSLNAVRLLKIISDTQKNPHKNCRRPFHQMSTPLSSTTRTKTIAQALRAHVSAFQKRRYDPPAKVRLMDGTDVLPTPTMEAAASASLGAAWFVVVAQLLLLVAFVAFGRAASVFHGVLWTLPCTLFNAMFLLAWRSDPGIVRRPATVAAAGHQDGGASAVITFDTPDCNDSQCLARPRSSSGGSSSAAAEQPIDLLNATTRSSIPRTNEDGIPLRWCDDCNHWQPLRARHCDKCGVCVRKFDHHCFWVGGCVGEKNHGKFFGVLVSAAWYVFVSTWHVLRCFDLRTRTLSGTSGDAVVHERSLAEIALRNALPGVLFIAGVFLLLFVGCLLLWHVVVISLNQTTWESASSARITYFEFTRHATPFDHGLLQNLRYVFCVGSQQSPVTWRFAPGRLLPGGKTRSSGGVV